MAAGWGDAYLAETRCVAYHPTVPRWNLRAPPITRSERREWVVLHTKTTKVLCSVLHMVTREFAVATNRVTRPLLFFFRDCV